MLTERQRAFIYTMRTPHVDTATLCLALVRAIEDAPPEERIGLMIVFLQSLGAKRMATSPNMELSSYTDAEREAAMTLFHAQVTQGRIEFIRPLIERVPIAEAAARIMQQFEYLRQFGPLVQAILLSRLSDATMTPYAGYPPLPQAALASIDEFWNLLVEDPDILALLYESSRSHWMEPFTMAALMDMILIRIGSNTKKRQAFLAYWHLKSMRSAVTAVLRKASAPPDPDDDEDDMDLEEPIDPKKAN